MQHTAPTIPADVAAHVLYHCDDHNPNGIQPGQFYQRLIELIEHADPDNRDLIAQVYPGYVAAVIAAHYDTDGIQRLQNIARGETA